MAILKEFFQHVPQKNWHFFSGYRWDSITFACRILYKLRRFWFRSLHFFWTHCRVLPVWVWETCSARKLVALEEWLILPLNDEYLSQFLSDYKVLWMTFEQLYEIFNKLPIFDSSYNKCRSQRCHLLWSKGTWRGVTFTNDVSRNQRSVR